MSNVEMLEKEIKEYNNMENEAVRETVRVEDNPKNLNERLNNMSDNVNELHLEEVRQKLKKMRNLCIKFKNKELIEKFNYIVMNLIFRNVEKWEELEELLIK